VGFIPVLQDRDFLENGKEHSELKNRDSFIR
jgi:hypothetical protein